MSRAAVCAGHLLNTSVASEEMFKITRPAEETHIVTLVLIPVTPRCVHSFSSFLILFNTSDCHDRIQVGNLLPVLTCSSLWLHLDSLTFFIFTFYEGFTLFPPFLTLSVWRLSVWISSKSCLCRSAFFTYVYLYLYLCLYLYANMYIYAQHRGLASPIPVPWSPAPPCCEDTLNERT